jgi:DNA invertase Pin-like site-specific DNA recombinase
MELIGYARATVTDPDSTFQSEILKASGCNILFIETKSGVTSHKGTAFEECMSYLRKGDTLVVTQVERLVHSICDLQDLLLILQKKQVYLRAIKQPIDTSSLSGKSFLDMLDIFAEFEKNIRRERQLEGIARAKKEGKYKGRKPTAKAKASAVIQLKEQGLTGREIATQLNIGIASVFRILKQQKSNHPTSLSDYIIKNP